MCSKQSTQLGTEMPKTAILSQANIVSSLFASMVERIRRVSKLTRMSIECCDSVDNSACLCEIREPHVDILENIIYKPTHVTRLLTCKHNQCLAHKLMVSLNPARTSTSAYIIRGTCDRKTKKHFKCYILINCSFSLLLFFALPFRN